MSKRIKTTGKAVSIPKGLAIGTTVSLSISVAGAMLLSWLISAEKMQWQNIGYGLVILLLAASFLGALTAAFRIQRRKLLVCMESCITYFSCLLLITALFFGGQYEAVGVTAGVIAAGGVCAAMVSAREQKAVRHRKGRGTAPVKRKR